MKVWFGNFKDGFFKYRVLRKFVRGGDKYLIIEGTFDGYYNIHFVDVGNQEIYPSNKKTDNIFGSINMRIKEFGNFTKESEEIIGDYWLEFCHDK